MDDETVLGAAEPESIPPGALISAEVRDAVTDAMMANPGLIHGEDVIAGLVDALAFMLVKSPKVQTIRERRLYCDEIGNAVAKQIATYQDAASKVVRMPARKPGLVLLPGLGGDAA